PSLSPVAAFTNLPDTSPIDRPARLGAAVRFRRAVEEGPTVPGATVARGFLARLAAPPFLDFLRGRGALFGDGRNSRGGMRERAFMEKVLVTGGCGFIGSNFVRFLLDAERDVAVVNFDCLSYAGNLANLADLANHPRYRFVRGDVADRDAVRAVVGSGVR